MSPPTITLKPLNHRDLDCIALHFPYEEAVKDHIKKLPFVQWSQRKRCWYMLPEDENVRKLINHCRGKIWIDIDAIRRRKKQKPDMPSPKKTVDYRVASETMTKIEEMKRWMEQMRYSPSSIKSYLSFVTQYFAVTRSRWHELSLERIREYNHDHFIVKGKSYNSQNQWISGIKIFIQVHGLDSIDLEHLSRPRKSRRLPEVLTREEVARIFKSLKNLKHRALLMLLYSAGLRIGEVLALRPGDIRKEEGLIYVRQAKGNKDRRVPLSPKVIKVLRKYLNAYSPRTFLFEGQKAGSPYAQSSARKVLQNAVKAAGIQRHIVLHTLRHSYATHLIQSGVSLAHVQKILGHASPKTTMLYLHLTGDDIRSVRSPIEDLDL